MNKLFFNNLPKTKQNNLKTFVNQLDLPESLLNNIDEVYKYHEQIAEWISKRKTLNTKKTYYISLSFILRNTGKKELGDKYMETAINLANTINEDTKKNKLSKSRSNNHIPFSVILEHREKLKKEFEENERDRFINLQYLILCLYTYQPPLRKDYSNMRIVYNKPKGQKNYLWKKDNNYFIVINDDKVSDSHGSITLKLSDELNDIIDMSLSEYPRNYLLSLPTNKKKAIGDQTLGKTINDIFKDTGKTIGVDILRSSYISEVYSKNPTMSQKEELAKKMRHSVNTAQLSYNKVLDTPDINIGSKKRNNKKKVIIEKEEKKEEKKEKKGFDLKKWTKEHRKNEDVKKRLREANRKYYNKNKKKILRKKILFNLNNGNVEKPEKKTIELYELKYNSEKKEWF